MTGVWRRWRDLVLIWASGVGLAVMVIGQALHHWAERKLPPAMRDTATLVVLPPIRGEKQG